MNTHLNKKNLFLVLGPWVISVIRYSAAFLDWIKEETKDLDRWTRKQLIAGRGLHPKSNVMVIYIKHRCLISVEECCETELRSIDFYFVNSEEGLLKVVTRLEKVGKDKTESKNDYNGRIEQEKIDELISMKLHGQSGRDRDDKRSEKFGTGSENEVSNEKQKACCQQHRSKPNTNYEKFIISMSEIHVDCVDKRGGMLCT